jgi:glucosamine-6-phosphate deaminase
MVSTSNDYTVKQASVRVFSSKAKMGKAAATEAAQIVRDALARQGHARIIVATGNSQLDFIRALTTEEQIDWSLMEVFHMDEYVGMSDSHPASFARWVKTRVTDIVHPGKVHYLRGNAPDIEEELRRYGGMLTSASIDLCALGVGENGHIAFNDPHVADFHDALVVKRVMLDSKCRFQQVGEGHFPNLEVVPEEAMTLTCPTLMSAKTLICCAPEKRKAEAIRNALYGLLSEECPASLLVTHPGARIYLDRESASLLTGPPIE